MYFRAMHGRHEEFERHTGRRHVLQHRAATVVVLANTAQALNKGAHFGGGLGNDELGFGVSAAIFQGLCNTRLLCRGDFCQQRLHLGLHRCGFV